jgi:hypothetical protein
MLFVIYVEAEIHLCVFIYRIICHPVTSFSSWNLQRIPIWWRWYYWANPVAWTLYGLLTSQYGDDDNLVKLTDGNSVSIRLVLREVFGYRHDFLCIAATMVAGFCILFAFVFAYAIKSFNFQRRWWGGLCY